MEVAPRAQRRGGGREKSWGQTEMASKYPFLQTSAAICRDVVINVLSYDSCVDGGPEDSL